MQEYSQGTTQEFVIPRGESERQASSEWRWLRETYSELLGVRLTLVDDHTFEGGSFRLPDEEGERPEILLASGGGERFVQLKESREEAVRDMAGKLGLSFEEIDGETIRLFILFHEAGHAQDFLSNFAEGGDPMTGTDAWLANSEMQLAELPFSGVSPAELREDFALAGGFEAWRRKDDHDAWCREHDAQSETEILRLQEAAYRALDKERYADRFAERAVQKYRRQGMN